MKKIIVGIISLVLLFTLTPMSVSAEEEIDLSSLSLEERLMLADEEINLKREQYFLDNSIQSEFDLTENQITELNEISESIQMKYIQDIFQEILDEEERQILEEIPISSRSYGDMRTNVGYVYATRNSLWGGVVGHAVIMVSHQGHILEAVSPGNVSRVQANGGQRMKQTNRTSLYAVPTLNGSSRGRIWYNIGSYVGQPYDVLNNYGYNCATLVAAVLRDLGGVPIRGVGTVQGLTGSSYLVRVGDYHGGY